ncbi:PaaI family thioesterase [Rhodococcoides kyotonense]|uniref:Uncharacterized domain 1-containing protein n=1 Tax=Rhodococcoides kyotonense TaxID=398843 RepID=A0A239K9W8_9NOCA|nr:PaaI family thioesterase [Rhodococcus kyotonensis]SNT14443.1 uncharacterized domain 1-containing protein [Rhodococcus kyotonensis]
MTETTAHPTVARNIFNPNGFEGLIGLEVTEVTADRVRAEWLAQPSHHQPFGLVHGGVYCGVIESIASIAAFSWLSQNGGGTVVGVNNSTDFLRSARTGALYAEANPLHRGRLQQLWEVVVSDENDKHIARGRVRLQNLAPSA